MDHGLLNHWKEVAEHYRLERDIARLEVLELKERLPNTCFSSDGKDYLRKILATRATPSLWQRIKNLTRGYV